MSCCLHCDNGDEGHFSGGIREHFWPEKGWTRCENPISTHTPDTLAPVTVVAGTDPYENPKDAFGSKKAPMHLIPAAARIHCALALRDGARKYTPYNWRGKRVVMSIYLDAAVRHIDAFFDGEDLAPDSGVHHLGHAMACMAIILDGLHVGNIKDDRPDFKAPTSELQQQVFVGEVGVKK